MKLKPYPKYKESGVQWIGEIPKGWVIKKIKHLSLNLDGRRIPISAELREEGEIPYYGATGVLDYVKNHIFNETLLLVGEDGAPFFEPNKNVSYIIHGKTWVNNHAHVLRVLKTHDINWLCYFMNSNDYTSSIKGSTRDKLNQDDLSSIEIATPSEKEQSEITSFLDSKTSQLNQTISKDRQLIELLKEKRIALINHAVTKGLNPKAKMKDSGIEWIGEVPEGWEVRKLKNSCDIKAQYGAGCEPEDNEKRLDYRYIRITDIDDLGRLRKDSFAYLSKENAAGYILKEGDVLFARSGATVGKSYYYLTEDGNCAYAGYLIRYKTNKILNSKFLFYYTLSDSYSGWIKRTLVQSTIENVSAEKYNEMFLPIPPKSDQLQISQYLDKATSKIDQTIKKIEEKIELLEEFKKSLIHHVVTGKVDVRESAEFIS